MQRGFGQILATTSLELKDLSDRYRLEFEVYDEEDGLGEFKAAVIETPNGKQFAVIRYTHSPGLGTDIYVHEGSNLRDDLTVILSMLELNKDALTWIHEEATDR